MDGTGGDQGVPYTFAKSTLPGDGNGVCAVCHTPHNATTELPLWDHTAANGAAFTTYPEGGTIEGTITAPSGASALCLGCHDGTANLDAYGGATGALAMQAADSYANFELDLSNDHPISVTYPANATDAGLQQMVDPAVLIAAGGYLYGAGNTVECASCHSMHQPAVISKLLRVTNDDSALCLTCHVK
ncbi:cytochrome c3 family protein [Lutimonas vermicola]|uniref:Cytochrome c3 family protein n=1 Tax=Lutimonas vermicola TaxID=414288 RepID=A0ABU9L269_9FLAO